MHVQKSSLTESISLKITCSMRRSYTTAGIKLLKLTIETLEQGVKYAHS